MRAISLSGLFGFVLVVAGCSAPPPVEDPRSVSDQQVAGGLEGAMGVEVAEVTEVAALFLAALSAADTAALSGLLAPGAGIHSVREGATLRAVSRQDFLLGLGAEDQQFLERMWDPTVKVQDGVAMVWAPFDFHRAGEFSHCGIDIFTLLKGMEGWQITNISYNVVREGCPPSPLGSPGRSGS